MGAASFRGKIDKLEIARGHDGFLRGGPDPVLVLALYATTGASIRLIGRSLHRFESKTQFPTEVAPDVADLPGALVDSDAQLRFLVLAIMLEEDGGADVQRFYGLVEHHPLVSAWRPDHTDVEPVSLGAFAATDVPVSVELVVDGQPAPNTCKSDKWIGAVCWTPEARTPPSASLYRLPYLAPNRRNDWTLIATLEH